MKHLLINILCALLGFFTIYLIISFYTLTLNIFNMLPEHRFIIIYTGSMFALLYMAIYNTDKNF